VVIPAMPAPTMHTSARVLSESLPSDGISSVVAIQIEVVAPESLFMSFCFPLSRVPLPKSNVSTDGGLGL